VTGSAAGADHPDGPLDRLTRGTRPPLLFGMTPPRASTTPEERQRVADLTLARLAGLDLDGLVLYDIADESDRNADERPFPYLPTVDPADFHRDHLAAWTGPVVVYRCVPKYSTAQLESWLRAQDVARVATVLVGAPSRSTAVRTDLPTALRLRTEVRPDLVLGGVAIPERHASRRREHGRLLAKQAAGSSFFVTQVVYDVNAAKDLVSDYAYGCADAGVTPAPIVFTLSICGSLKTLEFLRWLGVAVPWWMENALLHSEDTLAASQELCLATARELASFCEALGVPHGFNVESVSVRRAEIEATVELAARLRRVVDRPGESAGRARPLTG